MTCYDCGYTLNLFPLMPLWPKQRRTYVAAGIVMRTCPDCGLDQNHAGDPRDPEPVSPAQAAVAAMTMTHLGPIDAAGHPARP